MALIGAFSQLFFWVWVSNPRFFRMSPNNCFRSAHGKNQMSRLPRKNEALGDNGFFLFFCWSWVRVFCGFRPGPLKIRRPMMRLAAFRKLIASSSRRFGMGGRGEISLFGEGDFFLSASSHCFFFAQCTPKYNLQAPHAIVACITPVLAKCILLTFVSPFTFVLLVIVCRPACSLQRAQ